MRWSAARACGALKPGKEERKISEPQTERRGRLVVALAVAAVVAAGLAPGALAHSVLLGTQPRNDTVVEEAPEEVSLRFNEPVEMSLGGIRVYDGQGNRVDAEQVDPSRGSEVAVGIEGDLAPGTYTVAWRAISADSDPISGAFVFHVQERGVQPAGISVDSLTGTSTLVDVFFTGGRFFDFALLLLTVGGAAVLVVALPSAAWSVRRRLYGVLAGLAAALAVVALLNIFFQGAAAGGLGLLDAFRWNVFTTVLDTRYGEMMLVQAALAVTLALTAMALRHSQGRERRALAALTLALGFGITLTPSLSGHASTAGNLAMAADAAHVIAAALWTGGLGFLVVALVLAVTDRWPLATRAVPRFSNMAVVAVAALLVAGVINGYLQVRTWSALWETEYGLLLLAKIALVVPLLALGAYNNRYAVPRLKAGLASVLERRRFLQAAGVELLIMVAVVAVTAVLVNAEPARTEAMMGEMAMEEGAMEAGAGDHEPFESEVDLGGTMAHVVVEPAMPGENSVHLTFEQADAEELTEVSVSASLPSEEIGPLEFPAEPVQGQPGEYVAEDASLSLPGEWELRIEALVGEFDLLTETITVPIGEE
ncbi:MAG TPA: CopD family protein [Gaiellaceae bacterium]|nr:CopD family protein [Gaiellaceae bacterium]